MRQKNLTNKDNRNFLARLTVALAPQDELVAYRAREVSRKQAGLKEKTEISVSVPERSARFLGLI